MKIMIASAAAAFFAANVGAVEMYGHFGADNPDLAPHQVSAEEFVGVQPSVGDTVDRYQGLAESNPDLFRGDRTTSIESTGRPDIYMNVSGNPDLKY